ncbi:unnamed protein product, partial [marine sediment metagenome]
GGMIEANIYIIAVVTVIMSIITTSGRLTAVFCVLFLHIVNFLVLVQLRGTTGWYYDGSRLMGIGVWLVPLNLILVAIVARHPK